MLPLSLALIASLFGDDAAERVADATEYTWHRDADVDPFAGQLNLLATQSGLV